MAASLKLFPGSTVRWCEHRHSLARWIFFADQGEFRTGDYQEIMNKASCLSLVSNAILIWNTLQIARIVETLRQTGTPIADEDLAHVSPLLHRHVIPNGTYHFLRAIEGDNFVVEYATVCFRSQEDFGPIISFTSQKGVRSVDIHGAA